MALNFEKHVLDPIKFGKWLWPQYDFYKQQRDVIYSVMDNYRTIVPAGHKLGKDFVGAFIVLWFFLTRHPVHIVTTSADGSQLEAVLWGEIRRLIQEARYNLDAAKGGPIVNNHLHLKKVVNGEVCGQSYCIGRVAAKGEGMAGHHLAHKVVVEEIGRDLPRGRTSGLLDAPKGLLGSPKGSSDAPKGSAGTVSIAIPMTLFLADEASGVDQTSLTRAESWAHRVLYTGNPYDCQNDFRTSVRDGDVAADGDGTGRLVYQQKIVKIKAEDSPNVRLAKTEIAAGKRPSGDILVPGVLTWDEYQYRRKKWDPIRQCVGLDAEFYEGAENLLYPAVWLNRAETVADGLRSIRKFRKAEAMGVDTAQGGDNTCWTIVDYRGLIEQISMKTPDTNVIVGRTLALMYSYGIPADRVIFDAGDGKQHVDRMRAKGHDVKAIAFGTTPTPLPRVGTVGLDQKVQIFERRMAFKNIRAQMYWQVRELITPEPSELNESPMVQAERMLAELRGESQVSPDSPAKGWGIPAEYSELRRQMSLIPLTYGGEGKLYILPKDNTDPRSTEPTLKKLLGCSPDELDSLVLAVHALTISSEDVVGRGIV